MTNTITRIDNYSNNANKSLPTINKNQTHQDSKNTDNGNYNKDVIARRIANKLYFPTKNYHFANDNQSSNSK